MAILSYPNLFDRLKVLIKYFNILETRQTSESSSNLPLPYIKNEILSPFETQDETKVLQTLEADFANSILDVNSLKLSIIMWFENVLGGTAGTLGVHSTMASEVLKALVIAMDRDSQTINARELIVHASDVDTDGTIKPLGSNVGTGRLIYSFLRTGSDASEIADEEVLQCICTLPTTARQELFQLSGEGNNSRESYLGQGSGLGPAISVLGRSLTNCNFADWTSGEANNWNPTVGAWDTEIVQETSVVYEGDYSVKTAFAEGDWKITHTIPITLLPDTPYVVALAVRKVATATGTLRFGISNGDGVSAFVSGCVKSIDVATLTTSYVLQYLVFKTPTAIDTTWLFGISMDTPGVADIYFDMAQLGAMTLFNDMGFALIAGETGFGVGDKFGSGSENTGFKIDEDAAGIIQKFIGRCFNTQLPSATGAGETIADP